MVTIFKNIENNKGPDKMSLAFGIEGFQNLSDTKNKDFIKNIKKEVMNQAIEWCRNNIKGFNVSVEVDANNIIVKGNNCYIDDDTLERLPYKIYKVEGNFSVCGDPTVPRTMNLRSLENFPEIVTGNFNIKLNPNLTSLVGGPTEVGGYYNCAHCGLTTLNGIASNIGYYIAAYKNPLENIDILEKTNFTNIDLEFCDEVRGTETYKYLYESGRLYNNDKYA
jgi:hypothetical protein